MSGAGLVQYVLGATGMNSDENVQLLCLLC